MTDCLSFVMTIQTTDPDGGHYFSEVTGACKACSKWNRDKKSCAPEDAAAARLNCHRYGEHAMDKACFTKLEDKGQEKLLLTFTRAHVKGRDQIMP